MNYCKVKGCRFADKHTTSGHKCGVKGCNKYCHGQYEHYNKKMKEELCKFDEEILPSDLQCKILNCSFKKYHKTESHQCKMCKRFGHGINTCIFKNLDNLQDNLLNNISKKKLLIL